jgi:hypothetical protein
MSLSRTSRRAGAHTQLVDAVMDAYVTWREESAAVTVTYEIWRRASRDGRPAAYDSYVTALDREEHAAARYRDLIDRSSAR